MCECLCFLELESQPFALNRNGNITTSTPKRENPPHILEKWPTRDLCNCEHTHTLTHSHTYINMNISFPQQKFIENSTGRANTYFCTMSIDFFPVLPSINTLPLQFSIELRTINKKYHDDKKFQSISSLLCVNVNEGKFISSRQVIYKSIL